MAETKSALNLSSHAGQFGFTNSDDVYQAVRAYRGAAIADGWRAEPTYPQHEDLDRATSLAKDGFVMRVLARVKKPGEKWKYETRVSIWGPDGLAIPAIAPYDWARIQSGVTSCEHCGATNVPTERFYFAGRACTSCLPGLRAKYERGNWTD